MRTFNYNKDLNILETIVALEVKIEDIINHYNTISHDDSLPRELNVIIDCRKSKFNLEIDKIDLSQKSLNEAICKYKSIKEAIVVDQPFATAVATIFRTYYSKGNSYQFQVFSTIEAAYSWLL